MSDDLINRKALLDRLRGNVLVDVTEELEKVIEDQPTAFDKENVIEEIRERVGDCYLEYCGKYNNCLQCRADEAVKIVEKGGIE